MKLILKNTFLLLLLSIALACQRTSKPGYLYIKADSTQKYQIFKKERHKYVSIQNAEFNRNIQLDEGEYIILTQCSQRNVHIEKEKVTKLNAYSVEFHSPIKKRKKGSFTIYCHMNSYLTQTKKINDTYKLYSISPSIELLVGLSELKLNFLSPLYKENKIDINLAAFSLRSTSTSREKNEAYFLSPDSDKSILTKSQKLGEWFHLIPGKYKVFLNGSSKSISLKENELLEMSSSQIIIKTPKKTHDEDKPQTNQIILNDNSQLYYNQEYNLLPGTVKIKLDGSLHESIHELLPNKVHNYQARAITVKRYCEPYNWRCLGKENILIFEGKESYPKIEATTDKIIYYDFVKARIGIEGTQNLQYSIPIKISFWYSSWVN